MFLVTDKIFSIPFKDIKQIPPMFSFSYHMYYSVVKHGRLLIEYTLYKNHSQISQENILSVNLQSLPYS